MKFNFLKFDKCVYSDDYVREIGKKIDGCNNCMIKLGVLSILLCQIFTGDPKKSKISSLSVFVVCNRWHT